MIKKYVVNDFGYSVKELIIKKETPKQYQFENHERVDKSRMDRVISKYGNYIYYDTMSIDERTVKFLLDNQMLKTINDLKRAYEYNIRQVEDKRQLLELDV